MTLHDEVTELLQTAERVEHLMQKLWSSSEFSALCERWNAWHDEWRTLEQWKTIEGGWSRYGDRMKLEPGALSIAPSVEYSEYDRLYFEETDYDGDKTWDTMPLDYVRDPDAWEREREQRGDLIKRADRAAKLAEQADQIAEKTRQSMIETLESSGYTVIPRSGS